MILFEQFVGIDISKKTFDAALICGRSNRCTHKCFTQNKSGFTGFLQWLQSNNADINQALICMEHTGLYTHGLINFLVTIKANVWVEMAIKIKRSMGLQRGGDDKASAQMIADYAVRFTDRARLWKPADTKLSGLRNLIVQRDRIVNALKQLRVPLQELKSCGGEKEAAALERLQKPAITGLEKTKEKIETAIDAYISADEKMNKHITLICSVKGVGKQTAASL